LNPVQSDISDELLSPLDLKIRQCYCCQNPLSFNDYQDSNLELGLMKLMTLWQNPFIEIFCCRCHMRLTRIQKLLYADSSILEDNYSSPQMLQITRVNLLSNLKTIALNSNGRINKLMKIVEALDL
jgi:hypothetical protein